MTRRLKCSRRDPRPTITEMIRDDADCFIARMSDGRIRVGSKDHGRTVTSNLPPYHGLAAVAASMDADDFERSVYDLLN